MENFNFSDYQKITKSSKNCVVLFGGTNDKTISTAEIQECFDLDFAVCNKSSNNLSVINAKKEFIENIENLNPESILIHLGEADYDLFRTNPADFDVNYLELIFHIKSKTPKCRIGLIGLENERHNALEDEINRRIKAIADSEKCTFISIERKKLWNPEALKKTFSIVSNLGIETCCHFKKPLNDIAEMIYSCVYAQEQTEEEIAMRA